MNTNIKLGKVQTIIVIASLLASFFSFASPVMAATIWQENFDDSGIQGKGAIGPGPTIDMTGVTNWTIDVSSATLANGYDWFRVNNDVFEGRDLDGEAIWESETINISSYTNVSFSLDAIEDGDHEGSDYFDVYYSVDGSPFTLIPNWNGRGNASHTLTGDIPDDGDWGSETVTQNVTGNTLQIRVVMMNNAGSEYLQLDNVIVTGSSASGTAPTVSSTTPANGATDVALDADISINFSEDVTVSGAWFSISCTGSGVHSATVSGGHQNYVLNPDVNFDNGETCMVTIYKDQVTDTGDTPSTNMTEDYSFSFETASASVTSNVIINEVDADQVSTDSAEFVELYDGGVGNTDLTGLILVLFNGSDDASYEAFDLDGQSTDANGYFVFCGDANNVVNCDLDVSPDTTNLIQNGADAVALYLGDAADFPEDTPVSTTDLLDAIVYDTDDPDDAGLLPLLNAGQPQVNERGGGDGTAHSNQRCSNGSGGARNTDTYAQHPPTSGEVNFCACGDPATLIHDIQGNGMSSPEDGNVHVIEGVVVGDFQTSAHLRGFFLQEEDADADTDTTTSEGIFVYDGSSPAVDVNVGDVVRVEGQVDEFYDLTELTNVSSVEICPPGGVASAATVILPVTSVSDWEWYEGMLINIPQTLYATGNYYQGRYGEVDLSVNDRLDTPTNVVEPGAPAIALQDLNDRSRIQLEDGRTTQNPVPVPYIGTGGTLRAGDTIPELTGVLHYAYGAYEVHPTGAVNFTRVNTREATPPPVGTTVKVASFNVLNYFTTLDDSGPICGPTGGMDCRGADNAAEFTRQRDKIIDAIVKMDADVIGLMEMENHPTDAALQDLVSGLNAVAGAGTYALINTGPIGTDVIKVAFIYKPGVVTPVASFAILDSSVDPTFNDQRNRPVLAQTFQENGGGEKFTVAVNHLKSKGSACDDIGDPDTGDGQGNCNLTRTAAATALVNWLAGDPTFSGDPDSLIIGDLNSYAQEDPIDAIKAGGYTNLLETLADPYTYVYYGQAGYLDHALTNSSLANQVSGVAIWHINTDEPAALDYNDYNQPAGLYNPDPYRASDHDSVLIGLDLSGPTAIELASFTAAPGISSARLAWETGTEIDNAGFNLYRATAPDGPYTQINAALIAAEGDPVAGASYSFLNKGLAAGTYYYKLEDVDLNGVTTLHGPVSATVLPGLRKPSYRPVAP